MINSRPPNPHPPDPNAAISTEAVIYTAQARTWMLSNAIYRFTHHWQLTLLSILLGCLLGWGIQYLWPSNYRASSEVYVAINPYRVFSDTTFLALARPKYSNIDDFKNWQMSQLETVIFTDAFIEATLEYLRQQDDYWLAVDVQNLGDTLSADWRSAGAWSLIANHPQADRASQAVQAWSAISIQRVQAAILSAQETFRIDQELDAATQMRQQAGMRLAQLIAAKSSLQTWQAAVTQLPTNQPLQLAERWHVLSLITPVADFTPAWMRLLEEQPADTAHPAEYGAWIDQVIIHINAETGALNEQIHLLEQQQTDLAIRYTSVFAASLGLSPNLEIQGFELTAPKIVRPTGMLIILGGLAGLLVWLMIQLALISNPTPIPGETAQQETRGVMPK